MRGFVLVSLVAISTGIPMRVYADPCTDPVKIEQGKPAKCDGHGISVEDHRSFLKAVEERDQCKNQDLPAAFKTIETRNQACEEVKTVMAKLVSDNNKDALKVVEPPSFFDSFEGGLTVGIGASVVLAILGAVVYASVR